MVLVGKQRILLFAHKSTGQWIVQDADGEMWVLPAVDDQPWDHRQPFREVTDNELESVPRHYLEMLGLPS
jgi:hypothetical protein